MLRRHTQQQATHRQEDNHHASHRHHAKTVAI
jgi:hypothetical protein